MSQPVAKKGDKAVGVDIHVVMIPSPGGPVPTPLPNPFSGTIDEQVSTTVFIDNQGVAVVGSVANNSPQHIPMGGQFQKPPTNKGTISQGSSSFFIDNKAVARAGDPVQCCNDPTDNDTAVIVAVSTIFSG